MPKAKKKQNFLLFYGWEYKSCVWDINFNDFEAIELLGLAHYVSDSYLLAIHLTVDDISEMYFAIDYYVKFTHC